MKIDVNAFEINDYLGHDFECDCQKHHVTNLSTVQIKDNVKEDIVRFLDKNQYKVIYLIEDENTKRHTEKNWKLISMKRVSRQILLS